MWKYIHLFSNPLLENQGAILYIDMMWESMQMVYIYFILCVIFLEYNLFCDLVLECLLLATE